MIALVAISVLWRRPVPEGQRLLWGLSLGWFAFFFIKALTAKVEINWPAPCYMGLLILFAGHIDALSRRQYRVLIAGFGLALATMMIAYFPYQIGLTWKQDPFKDTKAWAEPVARLSRLSPPIDFILTPNYKIAAEIAFYWPRRLPVYVAGNAERRFNQHDLWPAIDREAGRDGLWVSASSDYPRSCYAPSLSASRSRPCPPLRRTGIRCAPCMPVIAATTGPSSGRGPAVTNRRIVGCEGPV